MLVACAGIVIGSVLPWATGPFGLSVNGLEGDGQYFSVGAIVLAIISWFAAGTKVGGVIGIIGFGAIATAALFDFEDIRDIADREPLVSWGVGLPIVIAAGILGVVYSAITLTEP